MDFDQLQHELFKLVQSVKNPETLARMRFAFESIVNGKVFELSEAQKSELDRRIDRYQAGKATTLNWDEYQKRIGGLKDK